MPRKAVDPVPNGEFDMEAHRAFMRASTESFNANLARIQASSAEIRKLTKRIRANMGVDDPAERHLHLVPDPPDTERRTHG